jgi:hypothetical protein
MQNRNGPAAHSADEFPPRSLKIKSLLSLQSLPYNLGLLAAFLEPPKAAARSPTPKQMRPINQPSLSAYRAYIYIYIYTHTHTHIYRHQAHLVVRVLGVMGGADRLGEEVVRARPPG